MYKYDIFFVNLNPKKWHTQAGMRPCVIIQSNLFNAHSPTFVVVPLTTVIKKVFPSEFLIEVSKKNGLKQQSRFLGSQMMTVDKRFFGKKMWVLESKYYSLVKESLGVVLDWEGEF